MSENRKNSGKSGDFEYYLEDQDIVLLDEPFNALDEDSNHYLYGLIRRLKREKATVLLTSLNQSDLDALCDVQYTAPTFEKAVKSGV